MNNNNNNNYDNNKINNDDNNNNLIVDGNTSENWKLWIENWLLLDQII